jgi:hypothetical protein
MVIIAMFTLLCYKAGAQSTITYKCTDLGLSGAAPLKCDPVSEDDPGDLAECYSYLVTYLSGGADRFELRFPSRKAVYHWTQSNDQDKNDSLSAYFLYNTNPKVYGYQVSAYARDFTITVSRYDNTKGGIAEGTFSGTMEAFVPWKRETIAITVSGSFHSVRKGGFGDECRKLRRAESLIIDKAKAVMRSSMITPLQQMGWQVKDNQDMKVVATNHPVPYKPFSLCDNVFDLKLTINPNSVYGKMMQDSAQYYASQSTKEGAMNMFRIQEMQNVEIRIFDNDPYLKSTFTHGPADKYSVLHIPGAAYACRFYHAPASDIESPEVKTCLFFGAWQGADMNAGSYVSYPFMHRLAGPYLETLEVQILGPIEAANTIISKIDWSALNAALSK